jgi:hypothetical protein
MGAFCGKLSIEHFFRLLISCGCNLYTVERRGCNKAVKSQEHESEVDCHVLVTRVVRVSVEAQLSCSHACMYMYMYLYIVDVVCPPPFIHLLQRLNVSSVNYFNPISTVSCEATIGSFVCTRCQKSHP